MPKIYIRMARPSDLKSKSACFAAWLEHDEAEPTFSDTAKGAVLAAIAADTEYRDEMGIPIPDYDSYIVHDGTPKPNQFETFVRLRKVQNRIERIKQAIGHANMNDINIIAPVREELAERETQAARLKRDYVMLGGKL